MTIGPTVWSKGAIEFSKGAIEISKGAIEILIATNYLERKTNKISKKTFYFLKYEPKKQGLACKRKPTRIKLISVAFSCYTKILHFLPFSKLFFGTTF